MNENQGPKEQSLMCALKGMAFLIGEIILGIGWLASMAGIDALLHRLFNNGVLIKALSAVSLLGSGMIYIMSLGFLLGIIFVGNYKAAWM